MAKANVTNTMVVPLSTTLFPYFDDFDDDKNYRRILFRPGYAVQARELTQLQTILQNQIERFGQHIFVNGSSVIGGEIKYISTRTLNLETSFANTEITVANFKDKTIKLSSGNSDVVARVIQTTDKTIYDPPSLYIKYITGKEFDAGASIKVEGDEIYANVTSFANCKSNALVGFIEDSIYFYDGYFIKVPKQTLVVSKYSTKANARVGLELDDRIITENDDTSLLDPAVESSNYQAPGATRYQAQLVLAKRELDTEDLAKFIEISRLEKGVLTKNIKTPLYGELEEVFARRTYDESGNYTVTPFNISILDSLIDTGNNISVSVGSGKGYIFGYEFETIAPTVIEIPRSKTTQNVKQFPLNTNFGNYLLVNKLVGEFDIDNMGNADMHCTDLANVATTNTNAYFSTVIGSTRVKDIELYAGASAIADREYEFYTFNTKFKAITGTASSTSNTKGEIVLDRPYITAANGAYVGATIIITGGATNGDKRLIASYNGKSKIAYVDNQFTALPDSTSTFQLSFDTKNIKAFTRNPTYTAGTPSLQANAEVTINSKDLKGNTIIKEPTLTRLLFKTPNLFTKENSITNQTYQYRKKYSPVSFTSTATITAATGEDFLASTSTDANSSTVMENFQVFVLDPKSSGRVAGEQVHVTVSVSGSPESATFSLLSGAAGTFDAVVYAKMRATGTGAARKNKELVFANTKYFSRSGETASGPFRSTSGANVTTYLDSGQVVIQAPNSNYQLTESLLISDVTEIKKIYDLQGAAIPAQGTDISTLADVTGNYLFNDGQKDDIYDHASIQLLPGFNPPTGPLIVCTRYYRHTGTGGYFSVDSYPYLNQSNNVIEEAGTSKETTLGTGYAIIPSYQGLNLRDAIDFRPKRENGANQNTAYNIENTRIPLPATDFIFDYGYYLGRRDLIVLTASRQFQRISGQPSAYPKEPLAPAQSMVLASLFLPPYTDYPSNVAVKFVDNRRYTMKDIGLLDKRLQNLEYYVNLSILEKKASDLDIQDVDGLNRTKYGIFTDSFTGHALADQDAWDYAIATDPLQTTGDGMAMNKFVVKTTKLQCVESESVNQGITFKSTQATLKYTTTPYIVQDKASRFTPVADLLFASFEGNISCLPEADVFKDTIVKFQVQTEHKKNEVNMQIFTTKAAYDKAFKQAAEGKGLTDIINDWSVGSRGGKESNIAMNQRGGRTQGTKKFHYVAGDRGGVGPDEQLLTMSGFDNAMKRLNVG